MACRAGFDVGTVVVAACLGMAAVVAAMVSMFEVAIVVLPSVVAASAVIACPSGLDDRPSTMSRVVVYGCGMSPVWWGRWARTSWGASRYACEEPAAMIPVIALGQTEVKIAGSRVVGVDAEAPAVVGKDYRTVEIVVGQVERILCRRKQVVQSGVAAGQHEVVFVYSVAPGNVVEILVDTINIVEVNVVEVVEQAGSHTKGVGHAVGEEARIALDGGIAHGLCGGRCGYHCEYHRHQKVLQRSHNFWFLRVRHSFVILIA